MSYLLMNPVVAQNMQQCQANYGSTPSEIEQKLQQFLPSVIETVKKNFCTPQDAINFVTNLIDLPYKVNMIYTFVLLLCILTTIILFMLFMK